MDVATFEISRSPRRAEPDDAQRLQLDGSLIRRVAAQLGEGAAIADVQRRGTLARYGNNHVNPLQLLVGADTDERSAMLGIAALELWLAQVEDSPAGVDLQQKVTAIIKLYTDGHRGTAWR